MFSFPLSKAFAGPFLPSLCDDIESRHQGNRSKVPHCGQFRTRHVADLHILWQDTRQWNHGSFSYEQVVAESHHESVALAEYVFKMKKSKQCKRCASRVSTYSPSRGYDSSHDS
jgi:hypothetical protein